jgi:hypothetical protein
MARLKPPPFKARLLKSVLVNVTAMCLVAVSMAQTQDDAPVVKDFQQRLTRYLELKKNINVAGKQTNLPDKLAEQRHEALQKTETARPSAQQGDIFAPAIAAYFKKQIAVTMSGNEGKKIRTSLRHAEPLPNLSLAVNAPYPKGIPLQSTPPSLLQNLPLLPQHLQYRVVGSTLVLYDETSNLVVDLVPNAIALVTKKARGTK